jgi:hypothetical protein
MHHCQIDECDPAFGVLALRLAKPRIKQVAHADGSRRLRMNLHQVDISK